MKPLDEELQEIRDEIEKLGYPTGVNDHDVEVIMDRINKLVEDQFYLGYFADGFLRGWKACCERNGLEVNDQIAITKHHQWVSEVKKQMQSNISKQLT